MPGTDSRRVPRNPRLSAPAHAKPWADMLTWGFRGAGTLLCAQAIFTANLPTQRRTTASHQQELVRAVNAELHCTLPNSTSVRCRLKPVHAPPRGRRTSSAWIGCRHFAPQAASESVQQTWDAVFDIHRIHPMLSRCTGGSTTAGPSSRRQAAILSRRKAGGVRLPTRRSIEPGDGDHGHSYPRATHGGRLGARTPGFSRPQCHAAMPCSCDS